MDEHSTADQGARRLARLLTTTPDQRACEVCLDALEPYVQAELAGADDRAERASVAEHLDQCVGCAEAYAVLYEAQLNATSLPQPVVPPPDLSFLAQQPGPLTPQQLREQRLAERLRTALDAAIERTHTALRLHFSQPLLDLLAPAARPGLTLRAGQPDDERVFELELTVPAAGIERVLLTAYPARQRAEHCDLRIQLTVAGREWPDLAEIPVTLTLADEQRQAATDPWGEIVFAELPSAALAQMVIEIAAVGEPPAESR